jgi:hypothetical protein
MNLLAKIENEFNQTSIRLQTDQLEPEQVHKLNEKKQQLEKLAYAYVDLENQLRNLNLSF